MVNLGAHTPCREQLGNQNPQVLFISFPCGYTISRLWGLFPTTAGLAFKVVLLLTPCSARRTHHVQIQEDSTSADHRKAVSLWTPGEQRPHCHHHLNGSPPPPMEGSGWQKSCYTWRSKNMCRELLSNRKKHIQHLHDR